MVCAFGPVANRVCTNVFRLYADKMPKKKPFPSLSGLFSFFSLSLSHYIAPWVIRYTFSIVTRASANERCDSVASRGLQSLFFFFFSHSLSDSTTDTL